MNEEFSAGVQILLKRMESNPNEFTEEHGKWSNIRNAVFAHKEHNDHSAWLRGLTKAEIDALYEKLSALYRPVLDSWVMKNVLAEPEESLKYKATERYAHGWNDPRTLQNALQPGTMLTVGGTGGSGATTMVTSDTSILSRLKKELGIK